MATIVNNPGNSENSSTGFLMGLIFAVLVILTLFYFGVPYLRSTMGRTGVTTPTNNNPTTVENNVQQAPAASTAPEEGTQINIPDRIDVNVNEGQQPQQTP